MGLTESSAAASALAAAPFAKHTVGLASLSLMSTVFDVDLLIVPERIRQRRAIRSIRSRRVAPAERCQTPQVTVQRPQPTDPAGTPCPHQHESRQARCGEAEPRRPPRRRRGAQRIAVEPTASSPARAVPRPTREFGGTGTR